MKKEKKMFFNTNECKKIESAITDIEKKTSGEIVVMTIKQADRYFLPILLFSYIISIIATVTFMRFIPYFLPEELIKKIINIPFTFNDEFAYILNYGVLISIVLSIIFFGIFYSALIHNKYLIKAFIPLSVRTEKIKNRAFIEFYSRGLHNTRDKTGVLFLISQYEKLVYIIADQGIYSKIDQDRFNSYASDISNSIKKGDKVSGVIQSLLEIGKILEKHFPIRKDDTNELSNSVIQVN
ncbi:MAG: hypothetical protein A2015_14795 [Spirochaetes bacterium GWF1_31_7]|nr:MAG: hypothetical protein A2Y30_12055 [Spirochaetes bacterium GWE1_32_154]OHD49416.1 MAG: hypothetical protein A2015_14795 [Spirochaetes bacterium GWF1_31_7]OHD51563.1 MAG: hypothetical protein A2Y29_15385 [Spirochaetes bacterium GWE2_31_10]HBD93611.1 hypothetical protein [Spirochaetia bacterium]HBI37995.1 hypothetical protein [Spirochaetia bacterium]